MVKLNFEIVTAERVVYSDEVDIVVAPGVMGQLGILPNHAPLITMLEPGELMVRKDGEEDSMFVSGGFLEVMANKVTVLADTAERAEEIDAERAEEAKRRAEERLETRPTDVDGARVEAALRRSLMRLKVAEKRRKRKPGT
ncbi:MAG: F0F1 ATP synthase subunit epsilon [Chloroflexi bacterium CG07_land_8_20_14_0_80_51_10]|nr:MAG: F0F1 ATP synthase subunit epsilon [Chloroflexi bacterium CG07_land_8_20_14_0_80_51_10]